MADLHINKKGWEFQWTPEEDNIIKENYTSKGYDELEQMLPNRSKKAIQARAFKLGVKYLSYNKDYFNKIDTPTKAYWLGFLYADGYTTIDDRWGLEIMKSDEEHLQNLLNEIEYSGKIRGRKRKSTETCSVLIKNKDMTNSLKQKGIIPNKTEVLTFPAKETLNPMFYKDFIRGFFDGDGCVTYTVKPRVRKDRNNKVYNRAYKEINFCCKSKLFIDVLDSILKKNCICFNMYLNVKHNNLYYLRTFNIQTIIRFYDFIYSGSTPKNRLKRKYDKFLLLLEGGDAYHDKRTNYCTTG